MGEGHSKLQEAITQGHADEVRRFFESHKKPGKKLLNAGLHGAAASGHADIVELFIEHGADVNSAMNGDLGFGDKAAVPFCKGDEVTALHKACLLANAYCLKPLLKSGADPMAEYERSYSKEQWAVNAGDYNSILDRCKLVGISGHKSREKITPAECVLFGDAEKSEKERNVCLQMLMLKGLNVNWNNPDGDTLLHLAALRLQRDICMTLVSQGANVAAVNRKGRTPFHSYAQGVADRLGFLMINDIKKPEAEIRRVGISEGWGDGISWFARVGADVNATDTNGLTPLHVACYAFSYHTFSMSFRISALDYAEQYFAECEIYRRFVQAGANLNAQDSAGRDPLTMIKDCIGYKLAQKGKPFD